MKTIARFTAALIFAVTLFAAPATSARTPAEEVLWEPAAATSVALTSPVLRVGDFQALRITVTPSTAAGYASRVATVSCHDSAGTQIWAFDAVTATTTIPAMIVIDKTLSATVPTGATFYRVDPCPRTKVSIANASGTFRVRVSGTRRDE